ncbi:MAG: histidine phosphatase family protein [Gemmatimonadaceae bacterium]
MRHSLVVRALAALITLAPAVYAQGVSGTTTFIVVRHAEKGTEPANDPPLTAAGIARAEALVDLVKDAGVQAVVSTQFARTKSTVAPAAVRLGLTTQVLDARLTPKATADSLLAQHRGHTVLLVGHSNTVPAIIGALGAPQPADICDAGYDNAYVVTVPTSGAATVVRLHYGVKAGC